MYINLIKIIKAFFLEILFLIMFRGFHNKKGVKIKLFKKVNILPQ